MPTKRERELLENNLSDLPEDLRKLAVENWKFADKPLSEENSQK